MNCLNTVWHEKLEREHRLIRALHPFTSPKCPGMGNSWTNVHTTHESYINPLNWISGGFFCLIDHSSPTDRAQVPPTMKPDNFQAADILSQWENTWPDTERLEAWATWTKLRLNILHRSSKYLLFWTDQITSAWVTEIRSFFLNQYAINFRLILAYIRYHSSQIVIYLSQDVLHNRLRITIAILESPSYN